MSRTIVPPPDGTDHLAEDAMARHPSRPLAPSSAPGPRRQVGDHDSPTRPLAGPSAPRPTPAWRGRLLRGGFLLGGILTLIAATVFHYAYFLPQPLKPTKFYLVDTIFQAAVAVSIMLSAATVGARALRWLRLAPRIGQDPLTALERALLGYALGTGLLALVTAAIGLAHGYYPPVLIAVVLTPFIIWHRDLRTVLRGLNPGPIFLGGDGYRPIASRPIVADPLNTPCALLELVPRTVFESAMAAIVVSVSLLILEHLIVPFWGFDVFMYHFALPKQFLALHALVGTPGVPQANLPYNNEMLNLLALNVQAEVAAAMVQSSFVATAGLAIFALGVRLFGRRPAWLGMALFLVLPLVLAYASSGLIDPQFAFVTLMIIIAVEHYRVQPDRRWILLAGVLTGIGFGIKYQTVYIVAPLMVVLIWASRPARAAAPDGEALANRRNPQGEPPEAAREGQRRTDGGGYAWHWLRTVVINAALLGGTALIVFGLWAAREWIQVGNPIYPLLWGGAEWSSARMIVYKAQFDNFGSLHHSIARYFIATFDWYLHWQKYDYSPTPPGPALALAALAPFVALARGTRRVRYGIWLLLWLSIASFTLWGLVDQLVPRYVLPSFGLLALLAAVAIDRVTQWLTHALNPRGRELIVTGVALLALLPGVVYAVQTRIQNDPSSVYLGQQSYGAQLQATQLWPSYWRTVDYFNTQVPTNARVLGINLAATYFFDDPHITPDMNRDVIVYLAQVAPTDAQKLTWLRAHGYTFVIYDRNVTQWSIDRDPDHLLTPLYPPFEAFLAHALILVRSLDGTDVYMVPPS